MKQMFQRNSLHSVGCEIPQNEPQSLKSLSSRADDPAGFKQQA